MISNVPSVRSNKWCSFIENWIWKSKCCTHITKTNWSNRFVYTFIYEFFTSLFSSKWWRWVKNAHQHNFSSISGVKCKHTVCKSDKIRKEGYTWNGNENGSLLHSSNMNSYERKKRRIEETERWDVEMKAKQPCISRDIISQFRRAQKI